MVPNMVCALGCLNVKGINPANLFGLVVTFIFYASNFTQHITQEQAIPSTKGDNNGINKALATHKQ